jgi:4-hydroxyphenylpyruvate dioxygenase-like putative hemolysin
VEHIPITKVLSESDVGVLAETVAAVCVIQFHVTFQSPHGVLVSEALHNLCGKRVRVPLVAEHVDAAPLSEHQVVQYQYGAANQKV